MSEALVGSLHYDIGADGTKAVRELRAVDREAGKVAGSFTAMASAVTAALSAIAVEGLVSKLVSVQRQFDVTFSSLKTVTGGADQASRAFERLRAFAASTPYSLDQAVQGFVKLKALGLDPSERAMTSFGNTAAAMGKDLNQMIEAVADASTGEFERLKEFGIKARIEGDKVALTFRGTTTTVQNSAGNIVDYLTRIGETDFAGAMADRMKSLDGDISNLQDSLSTLYLTISQSGFGDAVAAGVRKASEAINELTVSVKEGGLTEYFAALRPVIVGAELVVVSLAGAIAGRLVASFVASATAAYASATAMGVATVAARGFTAALALMGGPIGITITALSLLALNWEKVGGEARDAATMSEQAAERIAAALKKAPNRAAQELGAQLRDAQDEIKLIEKELGRSGANMASADDLAELRQRRDTLVKIAGDIQAAMNKASGANEWGREGQRAGAPAPAGSPPPKGKPGAKRDDGYLESLAGQERIQREQDEATATFFRKQEDADARRAREQEQFDSARSRAVTSAQNISAEGDPVQQVQLFYGRRNEELRAQLEAGLLLETEHNAAVVANRQQMAERLGEIRQRELDQQAAANIQSVTLAGNLAGQLYGVLERSGKERTALGKALFLVSKGLAVAEILLNTEVAAAKAGAQLGVFGLPLAGLIRAQGYASAALVGGMALGEVSGGRQYGGPVSANSLYRVNEGGRPEMFTAANGAQYLMPTADGRVTPAGGSAGSGGWSIIVNNMAPGVQVTPQVNEQSRTVTLAVAEAASQVIERRGPMWNAMQTTNVRGVL
jgi:hypothetical protein